MKIIIIFLFGIFFFIFFISYASEPSSDINPPNKIPIEQIKVYQSHITIGEKNVKYGILPDTGSMLPTLPSNSTIFWVAEFNELNIGDIVMTNKSEDCRVTHRIIAINEGIYTLKGDNNQYPDNCIYERKDIYALIVGVIY